MRRALHPALKGWARRRRTGQASPLMPGKPRQASIIRNRHPEPRPELVSGLFQGLSIFSQVLSQVRKHDMDTKRIPIFDYGVKQWVDFFANFL
jgi:hypothetical protein